MRCCREKAQKVGTHRRGVRNIKPLVAPARHVAQLYAGPATSTGLFKLQQLSGWPERQPQQPVGILLGILSVH